MRPKAFLRACLFVFFALLGTEAPFAQTTGTIRGTVKDPSGAVVPAAQVTVTALGTGIARTVPADKDGSYEFVEVQVGHYGLLVTAPGFKKFEVKDVEVTIGHVAVVNAQLEIGESAQTVTVEAAVLQVETTSTQLGAVMNDVAVTELPLNARNTYQLLQLQPGVQSTIGSTLFYGSDQAGVVSVNGGRGRSNNFTVNGGDANDLFANLPGIQPSPDAIQEFRVLTNTFDAEYGRNSGAIVNVVTKSGTNDLHGDVFEFFRNKVLNARNFFDLAKGDFKQNQFGGTLGGPIKKDRTFFFGSYEGFRLRQGIPSGVVLVPTDAERTGDFSAGSTFGGAVTDAAFASILSNRGATPGQCNTDVMAAQSAAGVPVTGVQPGLAYTQIFPGNVIPTSCFDPTASDLLTQFVPHANFGSGQFIASPVRPQRTDQFTGRFDHRISSAQQLSAYYYFSDDDFTQPFSFFQAAGANVPGFGSRYKTRQQQLNVSHSWTIGSAAVNEFRFAYYREGQGTFDHPVKNNLVVNSCATIPASNCFADPANPRAGITPNLGASREGVPYITLSGGFAIGNNFEGELPQTGNSFQWSDSYSKIIGKHSLKFGGDVRRYHFDQTLFFDVNGEFFYFGGGKNDPVFDDFVPNYLLGLPDEFLQGAAQVEKVRSTATYLYAQDSWKLRSNLTLNYGLRWEFTTPITDVSQHVQTFRPGQATTIYPCQLSAASQAALGYSDTNCNPGGSAQAVFPLGLVLPGDKGVPAGLTQNYYRSFAPRVGLAYSPSWTEGFLGKLFGGPGHSSIRMGYGIFYNPVEQLVLEQFSAEPPFGGSTAVFNTLFNTPFVFQAGGQAPNPFNGILNPARGQPVDWSVFRPILLFGQFQPKLRSQYSEQYNLTIERGIGKDMVLRIGYVGSQAHRLLATHDLNFANAQTCLDIISLANASPASVLSFAGGPQTTCGPFAADTSYFIVPNTPIPQGFHLPYGPNGPSVVTNSGPSGITLVGTRPFSSPFCQPLTGLGCPADGVPVFSNIFAQDTIGNSNYSSLQVSVQRNLSKGLQFLAAYTYSKSIDDSSTFESILNPINFRQSRSLSLFDARHRFVFSSYWQLPIPKYGGFTGKLVDGWALSGILTYQTGFPIRIIDGNDTELLSSFDFEPVGQPFIHGPVRIMDPRSNPNHVFFDPCVFTDPNTSGSPCTSPSGPSVDPFGVIGNAPRVICCGPTVSQTDFSIEKRTRVSERFDTEFRAEFFNTWNHAQFLAPDGNFTNGLPPGGTFGTVAKARDPRLIQFGLKLFF